MMQKRARKEKVLVLGTSPLAWQIAAAIEAVPSLHYTVVGLVSDNANGGPVPQKLAACSSYPVVGPLENLQSIVEEMNPDRIIVALTERRGRMPVHDLLRLRTSGVSVEDGIEVHERCTGKLAIESLNPSYLIFSGDFDRPKWQMRVRRIVSLTVAALGLVVFAPLLASIALAIKLDSKGPVFFIQERVGLGGRTFRLIKFRTMHPLPPEGNNSVWYRDDSARITRVGKWLRQLYLDEMPQFINILKGDMDLVGPRPEMATNVQTMTEQIPYYFLRNVVRPGLTGWAQIRNGYAVAQDEVTEKMRYDLYYIKRMSPWFDLRILVETVKTVVVSAWGHNGH